MRVALCMYRNSNQAVLWASESVAGMCTAEQAWQDLMQ